MVVQIRGQVKAKFTKCWNFQNHNNNNVIIAEMQDLQQQLNNINPLGRQSSKAL